MNKVKVTVAEKDKVGGIKYPCWMSHYGTIVHFTSEGVGSSLNKSTGALNSGSDTWNTDVFTPFHGVIKIEVE